MKRLIDRAIKKLRKDGLKSLLTRFWSITYENVSRKYIDLRFIDSPISKFNFEGVNLVLSTDTDKKRGELNYLLFEEGYILEDIKNELREDDVFWDVGAHFGFYSVFVSKIIGGESVYAFEPNKSVSSILEKNFELNSINADVFNLALADEEGQVELKLTNEEGGRGAINVDETLQAYEEYQEGFQVEKTKGDKLISEGLADSPDVIKIDVEGAEPLVIEGLRKQIEQNKIRILYVEIHKKNSVGQSLEDYGSSVELLQEKLDSAGYEIKNLQESPGNMRIKAKLN